MAAFKNESGFGIIAVLVVVLVLGMAGVVGWKVLGNKDDGPATDGTAALVWRQGEGGWEAQQKAPACPVQPMLKAPADLSKVTSVLYPGQTRGNNYKAHGGLRFDTTTDNAVTVTAPFDGYVVKATRNFAQGTTEVQYGFDIMHACGVMTRFGHLRELSPELQKIADKLPEASAASRIENVQPPVFIEQGAALATKVGLLSEKNTFFDWGIYDYRQDNAASKVPAFRAAHATEKELVWYGVCWLQGGWLPAADQAKLAALPAGDPTSAKTSDYCE